MPVDYNRELNTQQRVAVFHEKGPALVVAGAGTGKTRTLVYRVARLVEQGIDPRRILLLTFTRRAAQEMARRAAKILGTTQPQKVRGGTFHAFANEILRTWGKTMGLGQFTIVDRSDMEDIVAHLRVELEFVPDRASGDRTQQGSRRSRRFPQKHTLAEIFSKTANTQQELGVVLEKEWPHFSQYLEELSQLRDAYHTYKRTKGLLDYDDLLSELLRLLETKQYVRERIAANFSEILGDEYHDTNRLEVDILRVLVTPGGNIMAVGDEMQAIYAFRGGSFENIMRFEDDFPGAKVYKIEENYRSSQPILNFANAVMEKAKRHRGKKLFSTTKPEGPLPRLIACQDEAQQSLVIADEIVRVHEQGIALEHIAILFRSSYHSFDLEAELSRRNIPYVKYGGFKFAETAHVKDALSHLRWMENPQDVVAAQRALMLLIGIGPVTARAIAKKVSNFSSVADGLAAFNPVGKSSQALGALAEAFSSAEAAQSPADALAAIAVYLEDSLMERFDDYPKRIKDLEHLVAIASRFKTTRRLIDHLALEPLNETITGVEGVENEEEPLTLSTIHSAKGLEWKTVFVISVLDGFLPQDYAFRSIEELEEERRLLYVALTRAKDELVVTYPMTITAGRAERVFAKPSQFLDSIREEVLTPVIAVSEELSEIIYPAPEQRWGKSRDEGF